MLTYLISVFLATARVPSAARCPPPSPSSMLSSAQTALRRNNRSRSALLALQTHWQTPNLSVLAAQREQALPHTTVVAVTGAASAPAAAPTNIHTHRTASPNAGPCPRCRLVEAKPLPLPLLAIASLRRLTYNFCCRCYASASETSSTVSFPSSVYISWKVLADLYL